MKTSIFKMFTNIRNSQGTLQLFVNSQNSKICKNILKILICKGFIRGYKLDYNKKKIQIFFKYYQENPVISKDLVFNSKSSFVSYLTLCKLQKNYDLILLSTTKGIITHKEALLYKLGGFIICKIS